MAIGHWLFSVLMPCVCVQIHPPYHRAKYVSIPLLLRSDGIGPNVISTVESLKMLLGSITADCSSLAK